MKVHYKVIETHPTANQIVVRYWTDIATEKSLAVHTESDGSFARCTTDTPLTIPLIKPSVQELDLLIRQSCNTIYLEERERIENGTKDDAVAHNLSLIETISSLNGSYDIDTQIPKNDGEWIAVRKQQINGMRDTNLLTGGFPVVYKGETIWFHSNILSYIQQIGLILTSILMRLSGKGEDDPIKDNAGVPVTWSTLDDKNVVVTVGLATALLKSVMDHHGKMFKTGTDKKLELITSETPPKDYAVSAGWPAGFKAKK